MFTTSPIVAPIANSQCSMDNISAQLNECHDLYHLQTTQTNELHQQLHEVSEDTSSTMSAETATQSYPLYKYNANNEILIGQQILTASTFIQQTSSCSTSMMAPTTMPLHTITGPPAPSSPSATQPFTYGMQSAYEPTPLATSTTINTSPPLPINNHQPTNFQLHSSLLASPKTINRDTLLNGNRYGSSSNHMGGRHNGLHRKYSDADIIGEMNHMYKQSVFARRTGIDDHEPNPFHHYAASSFNRFGGSRKPSSNQKLSPPQQPPPPPSTQIYADTGANWNIQRPHYQYGGSISASPSPNLGGRKLTVKPMYWDSQHVRLQGNTSPIGMYI